MKKVASVLILFFASTFVNAGILLDNGTPSSNSYQCVASECNGNNEWWAVSYFTTGSEDWDITGFEFFATGAGETNYLSTNWKIFSYSSSNILKGRDSSELLALKTSSLFSGTAAATITDTTTANNINVTSFLLDDIDITLAAGDYYLAQQHVYSESTILTAMITTEASRWFNTDFESSHIQNTKIAQVIYGKTATVPEPALMALFGLGLLSIGFSRKKKKV